MSRIIKFRAWHKGISIMSEFEEMDSVYTFLDEYGERCASDHSLQDMIDSSAFELMQYTGLKDKTGTDIYEGDLIVSEQTETILGIDDWTADELGVAQVTITSSEGARFASDCVWPYLEEDTIYSIQFCRVIGNIYETPELVS